MIFEDNRTEGEKTVFRQIWKFATPSKVVAFSWRLLHDRIPTRSNLAIRNCLPPGVTTNCVACLNVAECTSDISSLLTLHLCDKYLVAFDAMA